MRTGGLLPPQYRDFISLESQARSARTLETSVVPGLLQTPAYARAVTRAALGGLPPDKVDSLVEVRIARQEVLRGDPPLALSAVLDEAVLRRQVGGPAAMRGQLRHLSQLAARRTSGCRSSRSITAAMSDSPALSLSFRFRHISDLDVVVIDHLTSSLYLERREDLEAYSAAFQTVQALALSSEDSLDLIARTAREAPGRVRWRVGRHDVRTPCARSFQYFPRRAPVAAQQPQRGHEQLRRDGRAQGRAACRARLPTDRRARAALRRSRPGSASSRTLSTRIQGHTAN